MTGKSFDEWAILELMGHRRLAGKLTEATLAGGAFLRLDIPGKNQTSTQFYSPAAVYCITPTTEAIARAVAEQSEPAPVSRWELPKLAEPSKQLLFHCGICQVEEQGDVLGNPPPGWELSDIDPIDNTNPRYWMCCRCQKGADTDGSSVEGEEMEDE